MILLCAAVLHVRDFRLAPGVNGYNKEIVELFLVNCGGNIAAELLDHVGNRVAVADYEHALAGAFENLVRDFRGRCFRDLSWVRRIYFKREWRDC